MTLKKWFMALVIGLITLVAQAAAFDSQLELATTYDNQVIQYYQQGRFQQALPLAKKALRLRTEKQGEKHLETLTSLNNLAIIYKDLYRFSEALPLYEKGYRLSQEVLGEKHPGTLASLSGLAGIYQGLGRLSEALPLHEKGYRISKEVLGEKHPSTLTSMINLAGIYQALGRLSEDLSLSEQSYRLSKEEFGEKHPNTLHSLRNLASAYSKLEDYDKALAFAQKSVELHKEVLGKKHRYTIHSFHTLGFIYQELGRLDEALAWSEKSYRLRKEVLGKQHPETLLSLNNLGAVYQQLGNLDEVLYLHKQNYASFKQVLGPKHPTTLMSLNNLAEIYRESGKLYKALFSHQEAYRLRTEVLGPNHYETLISLKNLVQMYQWLGLLDQALPLSEKAYRLTKETLGEKHPDTVWSMSSLAGIYDNLGRLSEALAFYEKAFELSLEVVGEQHHLTLNILIGLASIYFKQGHIDKAIQHLEQFVAGLEKLRSGNFSAENRQGLFKRFVEVYFGLSELYISQSQYQNAFRIAEMSKARTLLESLAAKLAAQQSGLTAAEQRQLRDEEASLAVLNDRIAKALENNRLEEKITLENEKNQLVNQFNQFHRGLMAKYPKYAQLSKVQIVSAKQGAKYLPADAVLISYLVNEDNDNKNNVLAFTLQANGTLTAHDLGEIPNLKENLENYRRRLSLTRGRVSLRREPKKDIQALSRELGKQLLEPLKPFIKDKRHWIISPSGSLALIPFETLHLEGEEQPVIAKHDITYVQSLSVLKLLQERDKDYQNIKKRGTLLAMGTPLYEAKTSLPKGKTSVAKNPSTADFNIARNLVLRDGDYARAFRQLNLKWRNLPGASKELKQLKNLFFLKKHRLRLYKQAQATEAKLQYLNKHGILAKYRYLVFSTHGYLSTEVPALSSIVLGQINNPPGIDGYVTAGEWAGYNLKSDLMVLSACETGVGEVVSGEGVMGLPYAFYVAGNKNTLLTLWSISDEVTAEFIARFFRRLKMGIGQIEALTATKREFIKKGGRYSDPMYWAAFVLYGV